MPGNHPFIYTFGKDLIEDLFKDRLWKQLPCPANSTMPGQFLINIIIKKEKNVHSHSTMVNETSVANDILQIADQTNLKEHDGIDRFLTAFAVIRFSEFIQKLKIDGAF